jgi:hypothetical protein
MSWSDPPVYWDEKIDYPIGHGYSPRPVWGGTCPRCGAEAGEDCSILTCGTKCRHGRMLESCRRCEMEAVDGTYSLPPMTHP